jgi:hypothetical protein
VRTITFAGRWNCDCGPAFESACAGFEPQKAQARIRQTTELLKLKIGRKITSNPKENTGKHTSIRDKTLHTLRGVPFPARIE